MFPQLESNTGCSRIKIQSEKKKKKIQSEPMELLPIMLQSKTTTFNKDSKAPCNFSTEKEKILKSPLLFIFNFFIL